MTKSFALTSLLIALGLALPPAQAFQPFTYTENFELSDGPTLPAGWQSDTNGSGFVEISDEKLRVIRDDGGFQGAAFFTGEANGVDAMDWADYTVDAIFSMNSFGDRIGLYARAQSVSTNANGYHLSYTRSGGSQGIRIVRNPSAFSGSDAVLAEITDDDPEWPGILSNNTDYRMTFSAMGNQLTGSIYGFDSNTNDFTDLLVTLSGEDPNSTWMAGMPGVRGAFGGNGRWMDTDVFTVHVIPEPSSAALLGAGLFLLWRRHRAPRPPVSAE